MSSIRLALATLLALAGLVLLGAPAHACSCAVEAPRVALDRAGAVFVADVLDVTYEGREATYDVRVRQVFKGAPTRDVTVASSADGGSCGLEGIARGDTRLFVVTGEGPDYAGNLCLGTGLTAADAERVLGAATSVRDAAGPDAGPDADPVIDGGGLGVQVEDAPTWPWALGGLGLGLALVWWVLRRVLVGP